MGAHDGQKTSADNPKVEPRKPPGYPSTAKAQALVDTTSPSKGREERTSYPRSQ